VTTSSDESVFQTVPPEYVASKNSPWNSTPPLTVAPLWI